jgi:outer membrane biosynthesis protein TonB
MKKERVKFGVYLPKEIYAELYRRQLPEHFSFLVACLLEEFFKRTDISISRAEMLTKAEQREYLKRKLREFFSQTGQSTEPPTPPVQEKTEPTRVQETPKEVYAVSKPEPVKEEPPTPPKEDSGDDIDILKSIDNLW